MSGEESSSNREKEVEDEVERRTGKPGPDEQYCSSCGEVIKKEAEICPNCGVRQKKEKPSKEKDSGIAAIASLIIPGAGQIYNGQLAKGFVIMLILMPLNFVLLILLIGFITLPLTWIWNIYDAYSVAEKINRGEISP